MRLGVTLPQFNDDPERAVRAARAAEAAGLDGVFVFDHLWPLHQPERPALHSTTLLGALVAETSRVALGPLVARVGLVPDAVLVHTLVSLHRMAGGRFIAALGTGDRDNRDENLAYGVPFRPRAARLASAARCLADLRAAGVPSWLGGLSEEIRVLAAAEADAWNAWAIDAMGFAAGAADVFERGAAAGRAVEASWGGQVLIGRDAAEAAAKLERHGTRPGLVHGTVDDLVAHLAALARAGATWAVCAPLDVGVDPEGAVALLAGALAEVR